MEKDVRTMTDLKEKVKPVIKKIRPVLQADGGTAKARRVGVYAGCAMPQYTLKLGVERLLIKEVPEVTCVEAV